MIKHINPQNVTTTPFVAAKSRALYNVQNDDVVITEPSVYPDGTTIALDYVNYNLGDPILSRDCNIALEQQSVDNLGYEEGITGSVRFDPSTDPQNEDGTYKSLVHRTIKNAFYNTYRNPTEIFGVEHIDFPLSKTLRNLSDRFKLFSVPPLMFGEKIQPNSVQFYDNILDDTVAIFDDGYQNLIAGYNLFSKVQEVRNYSNVPSQSGSTKNGGNEILPGTASCGCVVFGQIFLTDPQSWSVFIGTDVYFEVSASGTPRPFSYQWYSGSYALTDGGRISGSNGPILYIYNVDVTNSGSYRVVVSNDAVNLTSSWADLYIKTGAIIWPGFDSLSSSVNLRFGSTNNAPPYVEPSVPSIGVSLRSGSVADVVKRLYVGQDTASVSVGFDGGAIFNKVVQVPFVAHDTASVSVGFDHGTLLNAVISLPVTHDALPTTVGFETGSIQTVVIPCSANDNAAGFGTTLLSGSVH